MALSRRLAMVGFQQSAQALDADDLVLVSLMLGLDDPVEALVNPLVMAVLDVLGQDVAQLLLRGKDEIVEALRVDRSMAKSTIHRMSLPLTSSSTEKKSHAARTFQWLLMNSFQVVLRVRSGSGS
jgi:hypothetical protein